MRPEYFKREGFNVYTKLTISPAQAVLGDEVIVKTLSGEKTLAIPAGIQCKEPLKLKGEGIQYLGRNNQKGDHIIIVDIKTPTNITDEEKQLYKKLYEIHTKKKYNEKSSIIDKVKGSFSRV